MCGLIVLAIPGGFRRFADDVEDHNAGQPPTLVVQKQRVGRTRVGFLPGALFEVTADQPDGLSADRHEPLFVPFPDHADESVVEKQVADSQRYQFGNPQAATVQRFDHRLVAVSETAAQVDRIQNGLDLRDRKDIGQLASRFRRVDEFGGQVFDPGR